MTLKTVAFALISLGLLSCQSVPTERKNNCACLWERPEGFVKTNEGANV